MIVLEMEPSGNPFNSLSGHIYFTLNIKGCTIYQISWYVCYFLFFVFLVIFTFTIIILSALDI